jgi:uncharacterized membrane protein YhaH (DUF805 family)
MLAATRAADSSKSLLPQRPRPLPVESCRPKTWNGEKNMEWYLLVLQKYAQFTGRSRRKEYWMFALFNAIVYLVLYGVGLALLVAQNKLGIPLLVLCGIYALATLIPGLAVSVRRLHDTNKSGWWILIGFVPFVGGIILLVLMAIEGDPGNNLYGPNPKLLAQPAMG